MTKKIFNIFRKIRTFFRIIRLWIVDKCMKKNGSVYSFDNVKTKFYLPYMKTDHIQREIFLKKDYFETEMLNYIFNKWKGCCKLKDVVKKEVTLDIGANIGNHTMYFLNECAGRFVYCFEPVKSTFDMLKKNIEINQLDERVKLFNVGIGQYESKASICYSRENNTGYTKLAVSETGDMQIIAIDELKIDEKIGLVKIDIEGFEYDALLGMTETLRKYKPYIMIEIWPANQEKTFSLLKELGYHVDSVDVPGGDCEFICYA